MIWRAALSPRRWEYAKDLDQDQLCFAAAAAYHTPEYIDHNQRCIAEIVRRMGLGEWMGEVPEELLAKVLLEAGRGI